MSNLNYNSYVTEIANLMVVSSADANFNSILPGAINYAEGRIYREIDFLRTQVTDANTTVSSGVRDFTVPSSIGYFITVDNINIITPVTALSSNGTRNPLMPVTREFMDTIYPSGQTVTGVPEYYAMASDTAVLLGPSPDAAYVAEVIGEQRPAALSSTNSSTYLTQYIPDVFVAATMIFMTGYQNNFGAQSDNPQSANSWEIQYKTLKESAQVEQLRASFKGPGWTSQSPNPIVTPPRA